MEDKNTIQLPSHANNFFPGSNSGTIQFKPVFEDTNKTWCIPKEENPYKYAFLQACKEGHTPVVKFLIDFAKEKDLDKFCLSQKNNAYYSPLFDSFYYPDILEILINLHKEKYGYLYKSEVVSTCKKICRIGKVKSLKILLDFFINGEFTDDENLKYELSSNDIYLNYLKYPYQMKISILQIILFIFK